MVQHCCVRTMLRSRRNDSNSNNGPEPATGPPAPGLSALGPAHDSARKAVADAPGSQRHLALATNDDMFH